MTLAQTLVFQRSKGPFTLDDSDVNFLCPQKWDVWLPVLLFTLDDTNFFVVKYEHLHYLPRNSFSTLSNVRLVIQIKKKFTT